MEIIDFKLYEDFKDLKDESILKFIDYGQVFHYNAGEIIYDEKIDHPYIYFILEGFLVINKISHEGKERYLFFVSKGDFFNQHAVDSRLTTISAKAHTNLKVLRIAREDLLNIMRDDFDFNMMIIKVITKLTRRLQRQLSNIGTYDNKYRLGARLWKLARDYGIKDGDRTYLDIPLTQFDLSNTIGITRETLNRLLKELERDGLILMEGRKIVILNMEKLIEKK